ncbi:hypothetical protein PRIPAC_92664 [Pristionchus pacificus]|uniref:Uncharacterized protein n=1 Tax=Pristionchus pacificus TaxID=54126 RepID=A0A2A6CDU0_PRIPA|nr:hypothetical protein PRIPAC_92664 [Pristionchus pacificus]|eukprot:PDM76279.1 hypothetical protein PRIPAC_39883 [Pristionchus pacificus]
MLSKLNVLEIFLRSPAPGEVAVTINDERTTRDEQKRKEDEICVTWLSILFLIAVTLVIFSGVAYVAITRETPEERMERFLKEYDLRFEDQYN